MNGARREWILVDLDRRIGLCRKAQAESPGPWMLDAEPVSNMLSIEAQPYGDDGLMADVPATRGRTAEHIAAHDPTSLAALYEWMRGVAQRHDIPGTRHTCPACGGHGGNTATCPIVAGLASALGYPGDGTGGATRGGDDVISRLLGPDPDGDHFAGWAPGNLQAHLMHDHPTAQGPLSYDDPLDAIHREAHDRETGDGERGTPAVGARDTEGPSEPNGPAAVAFPVPGCVRCAELDFERESTMPQWHDAVREHMESEHPASREAPSAPAEGGPDDLDQLLAERLADPAFAAAYEDAAARAAVLYALIGLRKVARLSQTAVAERMGTTQSAVSDLEGGATDPRFSTLQRYARAVGARLTYVLEPPTEPAPVPPQAPEARSAEQESIVCHDYPNCDREHAGGAGGVPVHPPEGSRVSGDEPLIPDALLPLLAPPPSEGEADEAAGRVAAYLEARAHFGDRLTYYLSTVTMNDEEGTRYSLTGAALRLLLADRERLAFEVAGSREALRVALDSQDVLSRERDDAIDLAFRAAFAPEEGATVEWAASHPLDLEPASDEASARALIAACEASGQECYVEARTVGPWKPAPSPDTPGGEAA